MASETPTGLDHSILRGLLHFKPTKRYSLLHPPFCVELIVIGKNDGWKQGINLGKKTNQAFCHVPTYLLLEKIFSDDSHRAVLHLGATVRNTIGLFVVPWRDYGGAGSGGGLFWFRRFGYGK
jgi:hypothetical protein